MRYKAVSRLANATLVSAALLVVGTTAAQATAPAAAVTASGGEITGPLQKCVNAATAAKYDLWECVGGTLAYLKPDSKESSPAATEGAKLTEEFVDPQGRSWIVEEIAPTTTESVSNAGPSVTPLAADEWDTWCEYGDVCHRLVSTYIEETKGNAAYGNQSGAVGQFDVIIRTYLNGRQPWYRLGFFVDAGPNLTINSYVNCKKDLIFDTSCGTFNGPHVYVGSFRDPGWVYGNRLTDSGNYFGTVTGNFTPDGYGVTLPIPTLTSGHYTCPSGTGICHF